MKWKRKDDRHTCEAGAWTATVEPWGTFRGYEWSVYYALGNSHYDARGTCRELWRAKWCAEEVLRGMMESKP